MRLVLLFTLSLFLAIPASADYYVTGQIQGWETRFLGTVGHFVNVDIYKSGDDYYEMKKVYSKVSEYKKKENKTATSMDRRCQMVANAPAIGAVGASAIHGPCDGLAYV